MINLRPVDPPSFFPMDASVSGNPNDAADILPGFMSKYCKVTRSNLWETPETSRKGEGRPPLKKTTCTEPALIDVAEDDPPIASRETKRICRAIEKLGLLVDGDNNQCDISDASEKLIEAMIDSTPATALDRLTLLEAIQDVLARQQSMTESWGIVSASRLCSLIDHIQSIGSIENGQPS